VFWSVDSQIALAFLKRYPAPLDARGLGEQRLAAFLERGPQAVARAARPVAQGAEGRAGELEMQARREIVLALVSALEPVVAGAAS
jgi:hypothetical protein